MLKNKVAVITGASQGIGRAIALKFLAEGAVVFGVARTPDSMMDIAKSHPDFHPLYFDVADSSAAKNALMGIKKEYGKIDILVNNAAVVFNKKMGMIVRDELETMFRINVFATIELSQLVARLMARSGGGSIVNIASVTGVLGSPGQTAYSATKGAVIAFTKSAAKELAPQGIRVNAVAPGIVKTERFEELYADSGDKIDTRIGRIALGRLGDPEDVANAVAFLASDQSSYISGQILGVDGCASI